MIGMAMQVLGSVCEICHAGNRVVFDNDGSYLIRRDSKEGKEIRRLASEAMEKIKMYRRNGVYGIPVWLQEPEESEVAPFRRPGNKP